MQDFCKPGAGKHGAITARDLPVVIQSLIKHEEFGIALLFQLKFNEEKPSNYGLPSDVWLSVEFPDSCRDIRFKVQWFGKKATRLPESYWFSMGLATRDPQSWKIEKIDRLISPFSVVSKGARNLHGFNSGIFYDDGKQQLSVNSPDCALVSPGEPSLLDFSDRMPNVSKGWHFNLFNNKWGTNFPTWYSEDASFRFILHFSDPFHIPESKPLSLIHP